jgi:prevent-host-death family protein
MTELRTHPGEILDRVVNGGEAFVIEKNGRQKACLVPLSVFLPDISPSRIALEIEELEHSGLTSRTAVTRDREVAITLRQRGGSDDYEITVILPHDYPNACPRVYVNPVAAGTPHRFQDGAICIFGVMSSWNPAKHSARQALENTRRWLAHYEQWRASGEWPKEEALDVR